MKAFKESNLFLPGRTDPQGSHRGLPLENSVSKVGDQHGRDTGGTGVLVGTLKRTQVLGFKTDLDAVIYFVFGDGVGSFLLS